MFLSQNIDLIQPSRSHSEHQRKGLLLQNCNTIFFAFYEALQEVCKKVQS